MEKPQKKTKEYYDYYECCRYLEKKYEYQERDYLGKFKNGKCDDNIEYLDFWHWVIDHYEIHNGCFITFCEDAMDYTEEEEWIKTIYGYYIEEFADENGDLEMYVSW